ncbi:hypothetical protein ACFSTH_00035 [Paenibacillus yanchengensis]|uniref:Uncharacterized protein n=1 Tax=Paenibacillus yanchengensis TaxID=2035833 RepID=A0ABW4YEN3_9BACL
MSRTNETKKNGNTNAPAHHLPPQTKPPAASTTAPTALMQQTGNQAVGQATNTTDNAAPAYPDRSIGKAYTKYLYSPLHEAVLDKFGVGRRGLFRSKELNEFRDRLKKAARLQANTNISNQLDNHASLENKGVFEKKIVGMTANKEAYSLAKGSVNQVMATESDNIIEKLLPQEQVYEQLWATAETANNSSALERDIKQPQAKNIYGAVSKKAEQLLKQIEPIAVNEARSIVKGDKFIKGSVGDAMRQQQLTEATTTQVTDDNIAGQAIDKVINADTLESGLNKIRGIIDRVVPNDGDSASFECQLKIPFGQTGGYAFIAFEAEAEHDEGMNLGAQIGIGLGYDAKVIDVNAQFGMHVEAEATDTQAALNLISYGMYRYTNRIYPTVAEKLWGMGGKSGNTAQQEAEAWATAIEAKHLDDGDSSVQVGNFIQLALAIKSGIAEADIQLQGKLYTHYDKETISENTFGNFGDETEWSVLDAKAKMLSKYNTKGVKIGASGDISLDLGFGELQLSGEGELDWRNGGPESVELSFGISLPFNYGDDNADWIYIINKVYGPMMSLFTTMNRTIANKSQSQADANSHSKAQMQGAMIDAASDSSIFLPQFDEIGHQLVSATKTVDPETDEIEHMIKMSSSTALTFSFEYEFANQEKNEPSEWEVAAELSKVKNFEVDTGIFKFSVEKSKQLAKLGREKKEGNIATVKTLLGNKL